jgi:hypothetical protein
MASQYLIPPGSSYKPHPTHTFCWSHPYLYSSILAVYVLERIFFGGVHMEKSLYQVQWKQVTRCKTCSVPNRAVFVKISNQEAEK